MLQAIKYSSTGDWSKPVHVSEYVSRMTGEYLSDINQFSKREFCQKYLKDIVSNWLENYAQILRP